MRDLLLGCLGIVAILAASFLLAVALGFARLPLMNIDRIVTQHSLQYVQAHQKAIMDYYADYASADDAHRASIVIEVCTEANLLDRDEWPTTLVPFITANCH